MGNIIPFSTKKRTTILLICFSLASILSISEAHAATTTLRPNIDGHELDYTPDTDFPGDPHYDRVNDSSDITYVYTARGGSEDYWG
ncbi:MAG: hypothetical protein V3V63_04990, partial [Candidatus Hydrothermarchaeaceae archaeon]